MANQPTPSRPWFRLASMPRAAAPESTPAPAPAPAPEPRPALIRPAFRALAPSQPTQPQGQPTPPLPAAAAPPAVTAPPAPAAAPPVVPFSARMPALGLRPVVVTSTTTSVSNYPTEGVSAPSSSLPTTAAGSSYTVKSPPKAAVPSSASTITTTTSTTTAPTTATARVPSPTQSPKPKTNAQPPSPLALPPSRLKAQTESEQRIPMEAEQKTVLVQKTIDKPKSWVGGNVDSQWEYSEAYKPSIGHNGRQEVHKDLEAKEKEKGSRKKHSDSEEAGMRVITIAGDNKGAFMELIKSPNKHEVVENSHFLHVNKGNPTTRILGSDSEIYSGSDKEGNPKKDKSHKGKVATTQPMQAFMNSNVQGINNSIVYQCSYNHHDPGVHLSLSRKPSGEFHVKDHGNGDRN